MSCHLKDAATCTYIAADGYEYHEIGCENPLYLTFEKCFNSLPIIHWKTVNPHIPVIAVSIYAVAIFLGPMYMKDREPWAWKKTMAAWNLFLSAFSFMCMVRVIPQIYYNLKVGEVRDIMCISPEVLYGHGSTGLWVSLFNFSKFAELIDTFFIVIHKKPLIFLHYWHHITVLLYSWYSFVTKTPSSIVFMALNSTVHTVMYSYYFLMTVKMKPKWFNPIYITVIQLVQMVMGLAVTLMSAYYSITQTAENTCALEPSTLIPCVAMFGSYFILFLQFFIKRFFNKSSSKKKIA